MRRVVRRKLNRSMRSLYDSTDFANDAMERLAANLDLLQFPSFGSLDRLSCSSSRAEGHRRVSATAHAQARHFKRAADDG